MKRIILLIMIASWFYLVTPVWAEVIDPEDLPSMIGASNTGTEFYLTFHPNWETSSSGNYLRIYISSMYETNVTMEIPDLGLKETQRTHAYGVICFKIKPNEGQLYSKDFNQPPLPEQVWKGRAIKITADDHIICYGVSRFAYNSDGFMALPVSVLGMNYQVASSADPTNNQSQWQPSYTSIIGAHDDTKVTFRMGGCESCFALKEDGEYLRFNQTIRRTLNKGDVWLIPGIGPFNDLSGSSINADKPVAVISGNFCAYIPSAISSCDYTIEQEIPTYTWGTKYFVSPIDKRKNYSIIKIFAKNPNTSVDFDGHPKCFIASPGGILNTGYIETRAGEMAPGDLLPKPVEISSNQPINVVQYNTGSTDDNVNFDPFQMQLIPVEQFRNNVTFHTLGINGEAAFGNNYINIVYKATVDGNIPADLMWAEVIDGKFNWMPLSSYSGNPGQRFDRTETDGRHYRSKTMKIPYNGVYKIKANDPFAVNLYGENTYDAYGFPASANLKDLSTKDSLTPIVTFNMDDYGVITGTVLDVAQKDVKLSYLSVVVMMTALSENYKFTCDEFIPGIDDYTEFKFEMIDKFSPAKAVLAVSDRCGNDTVLVFENIPDILPTLEGDINSFGIMKSSKEAILNFSLVNNEELKTVKIKSIILENNDTQFEILNNISVITILRKGEKHSFSVKFSSNALNSGDISVIEGLFKNRIGVELENGEKYFLDTIEAEVANPRLEVNDINFATKAIDETHEQEIIYIKNEGKISLEVSGFEFPSNSPFMPALPEVSAENPLIINAKGEFPVTVRFNPNEPGEFTDTLKVISNGYVIKDKAVIKAVALPSSVIENGISESELSVRYSGGILTVTADTDFQASSIEVYDLKGEIIYNTDSVLSLNNFSIILPKVSAGVYFVKFKINKVWITRKFVI